MARPVTFTHPDTMLQPNQLGQIYPPYQKTYDFEGIFIDHDHKELHDRSVNGVLQGRIKGSLREADALKLYELAYFTTGNILEIGTYHGLSASIIATALKNSGSSHRLVSVDLHKQLSDLARSNLDKLDLGACCKFDTSDGTSYLEVVLDQQLKFGFVFIDHSHQYIHVKEASERLDGVVEAGGYVLFHDFNDPRNVDDRYADYGVYHGVKDGMNSKLFKFSGIYGCTGLYIREPN